MLHSANQAAANSVPCIAPTKFKGAMWWGMGTLAILIILFTGLLAGLTLGVMGIDSTRLRVWTNTGSSERRAQAQTILSIRRHPNWLLSSLILASVALAKGLPLIMNHLFEPGDWKPFIFSTLLVAAVGELLPQAIMPMFILPVVHRCSWFVHGVMWLTAPLSAPIGWVFRRCRLKAATAQMEGVLEVDDLGEFLRMHEVDQGWGGALELPIGSLLRRVLDVRDEMVGRTFDGGNILKMDSNCIIVERKWKKTQREDSNTINSNRLYDIITQTGFDFAVVMKCVDADRKGKFWGTGEMFGEVLGILPKKSILSFDYSRNHERVFAKDLGILPVAVVHETCRLLCLVDWLLRSQYHVAIVVPQTDEPSNTEDGIAGGQPRSRYHSGQNITNAVSPVGIITPVHLLQRLFIRQPTNMHQEANVWNHDIPTYPFSPSTDWSVPENHSPQTTSVFGIRHRSFHSRCSHANNESLPLSLPNVLSTGKPDERDVQTHDSEHVHASNNLDHKPRAVSTGVLSTTSIPYDMVASGSQSTTARREKTSKASAPWGPNGTMARNMRYERWTDFGEGEGEREILRRIGMGGSDGAVERIRRRLEGWTDLGDDEEVRKIVGRVYR